MAETAANTPATPTAGNTPATAREWRPFVSLRRAVDRLMEDFDRDFWRVPLGRSLAEGTTAFATVPAADVAESDKDYQVTVELPGMEEKNIEVTVSNHMLVIGGEKKEVKEDKRKDYYVSERRYGSFRRSYEIPEDVNADAIAANFANGVLNVTLPKKPGAQKAQKRIPVKAG